MKATIRALAWALNGWVGVGLVLGGGSSFVRIGIHDYAISLEGGGTGCIYSVFGAVLLEKGEIPKV